MVAEQLSLAIGRKARDVGIAKSTSANAAWIASAMFDLAFFMGEPGPREFTMEMFRVSRQRKGADIPTSPHAWGALARAAQKAGFIEWTGRYVQAASKKTHAHPVKVWKFRDKPKGAA